MKTAVAVALVAVAGLAIGAAVQEQMREHILLTPDELKWQPGPESLPVGAQLALLESDPKKSGIFTMRLKFQANYRIAPHWHPAYERVTVISGTFNVGKGETFDGAQAKVLPAGGFMLMPPRTAHFVFTGREEVIVQITTEGPWGINYVNPADDPRKTK